MLKTRCGYTAIENGKVTINGERDCSHGSEEGHARGCGDIWGRKVQQKDRTVILAYNKPIGLTVQRVKADPDNIFGSHRLSDQTSVREGWTRTPRSTSSDK